MKKHADIKWRSKPEEHDYPAAASYLSLIFDQRTVARVVKHLERAPLAVFKAKDIFADGHHRLCALYMFDEDALIPCRIVGLD